MEMEKVIEQPDVFNKHDDADILVIVAQIKNLTKERNFEEALELCNKDENKNNACIHSQKVKLLLLMFDETGKQELLHEALIICNEHAGSSLFDIPKEKIEKRLKKIENSNITGLLSSGLTNIYCDTISKEEIEKIEVDDWQKSLLLLAYFEKNNKKMGISYLKTIKNNYKEEPNKNKILNLIYERLVSKKLRIFDVNTYCKYLKCTIDFNLVNYDRKVEDVVVVEKSIVQEKKPTPIINTKPKQRESKSPIFISSGDGVRFNRYNQAGNSKKQQVDYSDSSKKSVQSKLIKDLFEQEVLEIGTYLYIQMNNIERQRVAVKAWDNFDNLIHKSCEDQEAMVRMISLVEKFKQLPNTENQQSLKPMVKQYNK